MKQTGNGSLKLNRPYIICLWMILFYLASMLTGCAGSEEKDDDDKKSSHSERDILFVPVTFPSDDARKRNVRASSGVTIDGVTYTLGYGSYDNGEEISGYETIARSGDFQGDVFGMIVDQAGRPVWRDGEEFISNDTDFSSLIETEKGLYNITQFESIPGAVYLMGLSKNGDDGRLFADDIRNVDVSLAGGLWMPSGGSVTPWNTHLGGEINEPDARAFENVQAVEDIDADVVAMLRYFGFASPLDAGVSLEDIRTAFDPYLYGYPFEVVLNAGDSAVFNKRYAMGRLSVAMVYVMPDEKTVYIADGGNNGGLFVFVADEAKDLSSGNLYAAIWNQQENMDGETATISWVFLEHATEEEIKLSLDQGIDFSSIFSVGRRNPDGTCSDDYVSVNTGENGHECLSVRTGMDIVASRLETRRYAAMLGATTEFHALEGFAFDPAENMLYLSIGKISNGMEDYMSNASADETYDRGGANHIRLPYNPCGCVYGLRVGGNGELGSNYGAKNIVKVICGTGGGFGGSREEPGNSCDVDGIANPDNLTFMDGYDTLIIAEDSDDGHENNSLWSYHINSEELTRIQTAPYGGEITSTYFYPDIDGFAYLMSVIKHPYGGIHQDKLIHPADAAGYVGFVGAMPPFE